MYNSFDEMFIKENVSYIKEKDLLERFEDFGDFVIFYFIKYKLI